MSTTGLPHWPGTGEDPARLPRAGALLLAADRLGVVLRGCGLALGNPLRMRRYAAALFPLSGALGQGPQGRWTPPA